MTSSSKLLAHLLAGVLAASAGMASAQGGGPAEPGGPGRPGHGPGMGPGMGPGGGMHGMHAGAENTMGWAHMTRQERIDHQNKLREMKTYEECKAYMEQHHEQMVERAAKSGRSMPAQPRRDMCAGLKK